MKAQTFKRALAGVQSHRSAGDYDTALHELEALLKTWPGNARMHLLRAELISADKTPRNGGHCSPAASVTRPAEQQRDIRGIMVAKKILCENRWAGGTTTPQRRFSDRL